MRKILVFLAATLVGAVQLNASCCNDWCEGWPKLTTCCDRSPWPSAFNIDIGGGYRQDKFKWSIAGPNCSPDILSEIEWRKLRIAQIEGTLKYVSCRNYAIRLDASFGRIYHGKMLDADYFDSRRKGIFSLSENNAGKGHVYDLSAAVGYRATSTCGRFTATPLVGYSHYAQYLRAFEGHQIIDACNLFTGHFDGLNSQYNTRWFGPWFGADFETQVERCAYLYGSVQWHMLTYRGQGKWNLRTDMGPFVHKAYGYGYLAQLGGKWEIWSNWSIGIQGSYRMYRTKHGSERVRIFFSDDSFIVKTRFNGAQWHAWTVSGILAWRY